MTLLTQPEIIALTGAERGKKQVEVLRENGVRFIVRANGSPALTWEAVNNVIAPSHQSARLQANDGFNLEGMEL